MSIILKNTCFIDWKDLSFSETHIKIEEGINANVTFFKSIDNTKILDSDVVIDCKGKLVTKSFALGHHHAYSALSRGMPPPKHTPSNFLEILKYIWWNLDKVLDKEMIKASALSTAIACAKAGTTFVIDHHASPNYISGSLDIISEAFDRVGLSHLLCYEISDRDGLNKTTESLEETENYISQSQGLVGLHASFTVGNNTLNKATELMYKHNSGIHIHVAEDKYDQEHSINTYSKTVVERLRDSGALESSKTILAHCLHINENDRKIINESEAFVVQNSESNLNNNVGYFNSKGLGNNVMIGTDGMHSDMIRSTQSAFFVGQNYDEIDFLSAYRRFRETHNYLETNNYVGDGENNLVILDYDTPTEINKDNFLGHFIYGFASNHVDSLISNGKLILKNKIIQTVDEEEILKFTKEQSHRLWSRL